MDFVLFLTLAAAAVILAFLVYLMYKAATEPGWMRMSRREKRKMLKGK